jgi:hypothetical protein
VGCRLGGLHGPSAWGAGRPAATGWAGLGCGGGARTGVDIEDVAEGRRRVLSSTAAHGAPDDIVYRVVVTLFCDLRCGRWRLCGWETARQRAAWRWWPVGGAAACASAQPVAVVAPVDEGVSVRCR